MPVSCFCASNECFFEFFYNCYGQCHYCTAECPTAETKLHSFLLSSSQLVLIGFLHSQLYPYDGTKSIPPVSSPPACKQSSLGTNSIEFTPELKLFATKQITIPSRTL